MFFSSRWLKLSKKLKREGKLEKIAGAIFERIF